MKTNAFLGRFSPLYFLLTGSLGIFLVLVLFHYRYPSADDVVGQAFVATPEFGVWVFLQVVHGCLVAVALVPVWEMFFRLFRSQTQHESRAARRKLTANLVAYGVCLSILVFAILSFLAVSRTSFFNPALYAPRGQNIRINIIYLCTFLVALPALLGIVLVYTAARKLSATIDKTPNTAADLFSLGNELLSYRESLQNFLMILGIILSMASITTAGIRAIFVALGVADDRNFPSMHAVLFGLIFSLLLLLIYIPTHFALIETSRKLRDRLCPLSSLKTLKPDMEQRKQLDELLQTNVGIAENLKAGLFAIFPLASSLIASLLGISW